MKEAVLKSESVLAWELVSAWESVSELVRERLRIE